MSWPATPAAAPGLFEPPLNTPVARLDFGNEGVYSAFTNPDAAPEAVAGGFKYTLTLKPETAEAIADDVDALIAAINRMLVTRLSMRSEGVFTMGESDDQYVMQFESATDASKTVDLRIPVAPVSNVFITMSSAISEQDRDTYLYDIGAAILDMTNPLEDDVLDAGVLRGQDDENLTFYARIAPMFSLDELQATPVPINNTVFDQEAHEDVALMEFVLPGNKLVFMFAGKQTGISYASLVKTVRDGNGIFYECTRVFSSSENFGTYDFSDVYSQPYIEILPRFYVTLEDFRSKLLRVPVHPYWEIKDTGKTLPVAASRLSVLNGGPVVSMLHCQDGSDLRVYTIEAYMPQLDKEEEEEAPDIPKVVYLQRGEDRTQMDISNSANAAVVKQAYAAEKGIPPESIQLIVQGKLLTEQPIEGVVTLLERDVTLVPGTTVAVVNARARRPQGARRTYRRRRKNRKQTSKR